MAKVCQLFSGSSGNSILLSSMSHTFLVDIGVSAKRCENALASLGVDADSIDAVFVTHEHRDHCSGVRVFAARHKTPVFASPLSLAQMSVTGFIDDTIKAFKTTDNMEIGGTEIIPFRQSHDSVECLGYRFNFKDGRSACICTDTGYVTDDARDKMSGTDLVFLESNHEISMLKSGPYPYYLKQRILGERGHLSNFACSEYIKELAQSGTTRFFLSHLSRENNTPDLARQSAMCAFDEIGFKEDVDFKLFVSPPENRAGGIAF